MDMELLEWLKKNKMTQIAFGRQLCKSGQFQLNRIIRGKIHPSRKLALKIEKATNGEIKAADLMFPKSSVQYDEPDYSRKQQQEHGHNENILNP